jgi:hypothetical protein
MTDEQIVQAFELVREHSTAHALPLLLLMETAWFRDREVLALERTARAMHDAMLDMRVTAVGRNDD